MTTSHLKPSHFKRIQPADSTAQRYEDENDARLFMCILARNGDKWSLTWDDYAKDPKAAWVREKFTFWAGMLPDAVAAMCFSPSWAKAARETLSPKAE